MRALVVLLLVASAPLSRADAHGLTDRSSHRPPEVDLPQAGGSYVDPVFGTRIVRVTDSDDGQRCVHAYSTMPAFNADVTRLLVACDDVPLLYRFDPETGEVSRDGKLPGVDSVAVQFEGATWSRSHPDVLFALEGTRLWRIDVSLGGLEGYTEVRDLGGRVGREVVLAQLHVSDDDRIFVFHTRDAATGAKKDVWAYDRDTDDLWRFPRDGWTIDEAKVDAAGRWVLVDGSRADPGMRLWDFREGEVEVLEWNSEDRPSGHADLGARLMVNSDGWSTGLVVRTYDSPHDPENILRYRRRDGTRNWSIADHVSLGAGDDVAVLSTYGGDGTWPAFEDEIALVHTDGTGFVRLAHTRSEGAGSTTSWNYWAQPRATVEHTGRWIVYTSDLGSSRRMDVMLLEIPESYRFVGSAGRADGTGGSDPADVTEALMITGGCRVAPGGAGSAGALLVVAAAAALAARRRCRGAISGAPRTRRR